MAGNINAKSGNIGNWKIQNSQIIGGSKSYISGGTLKGTLIDGGTVKGSVIKAGKNYDVNKDNGWMLYADNDELRLGNFKVAEYNGRYIIEDQYEWVGMSPELDDSEKDGRMSLWAGWHSDKVKQPDEYDFSVSQNGNVRIKNLNVFGTFDMNIKSDYWNDSLNNILDYIWGDGSYGIKYCGHEIRSLWNTVEDLSDRISSLE